MDPKWLDWAKKLQAIAQNGLTYSRDQYDIERYEAIQRIAAEITASHSDERISQITARFAGEVGHATPKVDVRGIVFQDDRLLLVRERTDGLWTVPGGWADIGETAGEAVVREVFEESGFHTRALKLLAVYDRDRHGHTPLPFHAYKLFFHCEILGGEPTPSFETDDVGFFGENNLPALSISRVTPGQITRCFQHRLHADWPTDFD